MEDDLRKGLLSKKGGFERMYEEGLLRVAKVRQQNDVFQKDIGLEIDEQLRDEVKSQSRFIEVPLPHPERDLRAQEAAQPDGDQVPGP